MAIFGDDLERVIKELEATVGRREELRRLQEASYRRNRRLSMFATGLALAAFSTQLIINPPSFQWQTSTLLATLGSLLVGPLAFGIGYYLPTKRRRKKFDLFGWLLVLRIQRDLLAAEIPNIIQIMSLLGFLNVLLQSVTVRGIVTVIIAALLYAYLSTKRHALVDSYPKETQDKIAPGASRIVTAVVIILLASVIYSLASLISIQLDLH